MTKQDVSMCAGCGEKLLPEFVGAVSMLTTMGRAEPICYSLCNKCSKMLRKSGKEREMLLLRIELRLLDAGGNA
nr:hypothetical protein 6 [Gammaproteobacteria bacterium]